MNDVLVIYHAHCWDGFCAAWLLHTVYPDAEFVAAQYGKEPPDCTNKRVFIADFSYPRLVMHTISEQARSLVVLDHHASAEHDLVSFAAQCMAEGVEKPTVVFELEHSGGYLTWQYLAERGMVPNTMPWLVSYTEDRDLWRWALPESREVNAALHSYPLDFAAWDVLATYDPLAKLAVEGQAIVRRDQQILNDHVQVAYETSLLGYKVLCVNASTLFSDIAGELAKGRPFGVCWFERGDGKRQYSLRSDATGVDVSQVAKQYGGGGHTHAAGFTADWQVEVARRVSA